MTRREGKVARVQGITAQLRERVDGEAAARATYAASATINSRVLRGFIRTSAATAEETSDGTVRLWAAADGRYRIDGRDQVKRDGPQVVANDGQYLWLLIGNRAYRWDPEPLPKP